MSLQPWNGKMFDDAQDSWTRRTPETLPGFLGI